MADRDDPILEGRQRRVDAVLESVLLDLKFLESFSVDDQGRLSEEDLALLDAFEEFDAGT